MSSALRMIVGVAAAMTVGAALTPSDASALQVDYNGSAVDGSNTFIRVNQSRGGPSPTQAAGDGATFTTPSGAFNVNVNDNGSISSFIAWCLELDQSFFPAGQTNYSYSDDLSDMQFDRVDALFDSSYTSDFFATGTTTQKREKSAAFQLALWEVVYDDDFDLSTGAFQSKSTGTGATPLTIFNTAQLFLMASDNGDIAERNWEIMTLSSPTRQDIVTAVPLPAAAWLLLAVGCGLIAIKRRSA